MKENIFETEKKFGIIYADPPWAYLWGKGKEGGHFAPEKHYSTMSTDEICALNIKRIAAKNCALLLWATMPCLPDSIKVISTQNAVNGKKGGLMSAEIRRESERKRAIGRAVLTGRIAAKEAFESLVNCLKDEKCNKTGKEG